MQKEKELSVKTSSARRSNVSQLGSAFVERWSKKNLSARSPSLFGMSVYKEVMFIVKINLLSPEKVKSRKIFSAWLVSLTWDGKDLTMDTICLYSWR